MLSQLHLKSDILERARKQPGGGVREGPVMPLAPLCVRHYPGAVAPQRALISRTLARLLLRLLRSPPPTMSITGDSSGASFPSPFLFEQKREQHKPCPTARCQVLLPAHSIPSPGPSFGTCLPMKSNVKQHKKKAHPDLCEGKPNLPTRPINTPLELDPLLAQEY